MIDPAVIPDFDEPIAIHARKDLPLLRVGMTVEEALAQIRREGVGERVIYFYAVDEEMRLAGVLPTLLLTASLETRLEEIMIRRVVALPATATVLEACEFFVLYKFFAFPVVDAERRVLGVVDVGLFRQEVLEAGEREGDRAPPPVFRRSLRGARVPPFTNSRRVTAAHVSVSLSLVARDRLQRDALRHPRRCFRSDPGQQPRDRILPHDGPRVNESVSMQSMTLTIQALRSTTSPAAGSWNFSPRSRHRSPARRWVRDRGRRDRWIWRRDLLGAAVIDPASPSPW